MCSIGYAKTLKLKDEMKMLQEKIQIGESTIYEKEFLTIETRWLLLHARHNFASSIFFSLA